MKLEKASIFAQWLWAVNPELAKRWFGVTSRLGEQ